MFFLLLACTDTELLNDTSDTATRTNGELYAFTSALSGEDSVHYSGPIFRQVLIDEMKLYLGGLTDDLNDGSFFPDPGEIARDLDFYLSFDSSASGGVPLNLSTDPAALQQTYDEISGDKNLLEKLAGNDTKGQHQDWSQAFVGWDADGVTSPQSLVAVWVEQIDAQASDWALGNLATDPFGFPVPAVNVTPSGQDLRQLLHKFLRGAIAYSQAADDYLDDDTEGKGLLQAHDTLEEGKSYTALEHAWDEGFGYFGAARDYPLWSDDELADTPYADSNSDGQIDLLTEYSWGYSINAAKRDAGARAVTDFTSQAWSGFRDGRALLAATAGAGLTDSQFVELQSHRDQALEAWELALSATIVHYINDTLQDLQAISSDDFVFADYAKHWSELKGFALSLQFNRFSPLSQTEFAELHQALGTQPVSPVASESTREEYANGLRAARATLGAVYGFDAANLGGDHGEDGW
jgi:hypothetical protein